MQTQDQKRALKAYEIVQGLKDPKAKSRFKTLALKFPAMVLQCGVLQTLAFYEAKDTKKLVFPFLDQWLLASNGWPAGASGINVVQKLCHPSVQPSHYRALGREAIAFGNWLKRAAEALLKGVKIDEAAFEEGGQ